MNEPARRIDAAVRRRAPWAPALAMSRAVRPSQALSILVTPLARAADAAIIWRLGHIPVGGIVDAQSPLALAPLDPARFWETSRVRRPVSLQARPARRAPRWARDSAAVRVVDLGGPSTGPGGHHGSRHVSGRVYVNRRPAPNAPLVLLLHGYAAPTNAYEDHQARLLVTRYGVHAARIDLPFHVSRRLDGLAHGAGFFHADPATTVASVRQATEDAAAAVAWARAEVTGRVGVLGFSLGGLVGCLLAAHHELDSLVAITPPADLVAITLDHAPRRIRAGLGTSAGSGGVYGVDRVAAREALTAAMAPVLPARLPPRTSASLITFVAAEHDLLVGRAAVEALAGAWGAECWTLPRGHVTVMSVRGLGDRIHRRLAHPGEPAPGEKLRRPGPRAVSATG